MTRAKVGEPVIAVLSANENTVRFLGFGVRAEDRVPEEAVGWMADALREHQVPNVCIELENGKRVYGCECWWAARDSYDKVVGTATIEHVDIDEVRAAHRAAQTKEEEENNG